MKNLSEKGVAITSMGCISSIGLSVSENWTSLYEGKSGIGPIEILDTQQKSQLWAGEIKLSNADLINHLNLGSKDDFTRNELLAIASIQELMDQIHLSPDQIKSTAFLNATTVGGMDTTEKYYYDFIQSPNNRHFIPHNSLGFGTDLIANLFGFSGYRTTISTACSSAANSIMLGARLIKAGIVDRVIVGGVDCLSKFTINGFNSLRIYSKNLCKPFDASRDGLNLGEGSAYLLLESENSLSETQNTILGYISGYGNSNDAFHQTASSDEGNGSYSAIKAALDIANLTADQIDYINAHGTATPNNDLSEGRALGRVFQGAARIPDFSSTKAFTGHTLAAAGAIEAVYSLLSLQNNAIFANLNFENPITDTDLIPNTHFKTVENVRHVLSNSLGFGGNCSALVFSK